MHFRQLRLEVHGTLAQLSCLVGLRELAEEDIGKHLAVLDVAPAGEDVIKRGNHQDPRDESILTANQELLAETGVLER